MAIAKRKKKFFEVSIPLIRKDTQLRAYDLSELDGKYLKYDLTRLLRGKGTLMQFKVAVNDKEAIATPRKIQLLPVFLKRMVRKGTNYVEDSFSTNTKESQVRIKPFLITRRKVSRNVRKALRNLVKEELVNYLKTKNNEEVFEDILKNKLQKELSLKLKKIYPLSLCEIRVLKIEKDLEKAEVKKE
jgi:ribosomal protein S3AE